MTSSEAENDESRFGLLNPIKKLEKLHAWLASNTASIDEKISLLQQANAALKIPEPTILPTTTTTYETITTTTVATTTTVVTTTTSTSNAYPPWIYTDSTSYPVLGDHEIPDFLESIPKSFSDVPALLMINPFPGISLKSSAVADQYKQTIGPPISIFGSGNFKTIFFVEHILKERAIYTAAAKPGAEIYEKKKVAMLNFYEKPIPGFDRQIFVCKLTDTFDRWAVLGKACDPAKSQLFGYVGYVAKFAFQDTTG